MDGHGWTDGLVKDGQVFWSVNLYIKIYMTSPHQTGITLT